jgi:hypothetical protein
MANASPSAIDGGVLLSHPADNANGLFMLFEL